ncbi:lipopolysaccharide-induced tumor necrosis factor-alpha factor-like isoform X3 [Anguilla rostrata]|uniref:lipopolysaccharide-induced tumor necrosis factor-alpha factor-like isoform X4 n=1 Tax=Anguilla anguilla TaxID=7936 RepID=UPI0015AD2F67|nr:lipopolysaccharide-induced tumor necrosis factor-alpha factor-like isoform X4 [Anguilla anguilla]
MEKGQGPPQDVPPPYTGPPANYRGTESAPQPGFSVPPYQGGSQVHLISGLSDLPSQTQCPFCQTLVVSRTIPQPGLLTWLICGSLALVGCWPCCLIPFCVDGCQDVEHRCSNCNNLLFVYKRL